ncbi:MAG: flagellar export protein FliJ [Campylobacterota bacterium]|nr:flagellar export protein FliJ [Campylobacterota bacterium]
MKTRFSSLVTLKKSAMEKSEQVLQNANKDLESATTVLEQSYTSLSNLESPQTGKMADMLASRMLVNSQRGSIAHNQEWITYAQNKVNHAKQELKLTMVEHEKFKYLEIEEIKKKLKDIKTQEAKDLDEIALMTYARKNNN